MSFDCAIEAQGSLVALAAKHTGPPSGGGKRGNVTHFSDGSRRRLMKKMARLKANKAIFVTLTYPAAFPHADIAQQHLKAYLQRFRYHFPKASAVWRLEYQKRGAPHFHILFYNLPFIPRRYWQGWWKRIVNKYIGNDEPRVDIQVVRSRRGIMFYVSKYIAKADAPDPVGGCYFIYVAYPHTGRFWGFHNRGCIPWAEQIYITLKGVTRKQFEAMKAVLAAEWEGLNAYDGKGGTLFNDRAYVLLVEMQEEMLNV